MNAIRRAPGRHHALATALLAAAAATAVVAVLLALATPAAAARSADPVTPEQAATQMCQQAQAAMGPMFGSLVGTMAQCEARALAVVKDAVEKCKTAADNAACVNTAVQTGIMSLASGGSGDIGGGMAAAMQEQALAQACSQLQAKLGAKRFAAEYGSTAGCKAKLKPDIDKIVAAAQAACSGKADPTACIAQQAATAEAALVAKLGGGPSGDALATEIAAEVCTRLQAELGDRFAAKYGSLASCQTQIAAKAAPLAAAAAATCKAAADQEACITAEINAKTDQLSASLGAGPTAGDIAAEIAENVCARLKTELGARFAARFKNDAGCRAQVAAAAEPFAAVALGACAATKGSAACIQAQVTAGTAQLQGALGAGPSAGELAADIAEQACARIMADEPDGFARTYGGLTKCRSTIAAKIPAADLKAAIARCSSTRDVDTCAQQAAADLSAKLALELSGPSLDDVTLDAEGMACTRIAEAMGSTEFKARFVTLRGCRETVEPEVAKLAKAAWATCKTAKNKADCAEAALAGPIQKLAASFGGGPKTADIAARLSQGACDAARKSLGEGEFNYQLNGPSGCARLAAASATTLAAAVLNTCSTKPAAQQAACIQRESAAAGPVLEKELKARAGASGAQVAAVIDDVTARVCQQARAELGALFDSEYQGQSGCLARVKPQASSRVAYVFQACGQDQACVRQQVDANVRDLVKVFYPVRPDPTFYEINSKAANNACGNGRVAAERAKLVAAFDRKFARPTKNTTLNCGQWFNGAAAEHAPRIMATCSVKRPADVRRACYAAEIEQVSRTLEAAVAQAVKAAAGKK